MEIKKEVVEEFKEREAIIQYNKEVWTYRIHSNKCFFHVWYIIWVNYLIHN
jgi:hypothetical protein